MFCDIKLDEKGTEEESTLARRCPHNSEGENLNEFFFDKSGLGEVKTLNSDVPSLLDFKDFNYESCSLTEYISLMLCMLNSRNAYEQNKALPNIL